MLPAVLAWNADVNGDRQQCIARALGNSEDSASRQLKQLISELGLPTTLSAVGVKKEQLAEVAERAAQHSVVKSNPKPIHSAAQVMEILELAW